jgi:3-hydroxyisobutyrate dehydrogenase-like beta-hydroxyacid dehydrogenase
VLHPGEMGAAVGRALVERGEKVGWASEGGSEATRRRAAEFGLADLRTIDDVKESCAVVLSVCPPHSAVDVAREMRGYRGLYVDANAVSPATARQIAEIISTGGGRFVDGGIVGPPPHRADSTRLYLSGGAADEIAALFSGSVFEAKVIATEWGAASALKMVYAAWTKGTNAMLLAVRAAARTLEVEDALLDEWAMSQPDLAARSERAALVGLERGWRWAFELEEVGRTFASAELPDGFGAAAAAVFRQLGAGVDGAEPERTLSRLTDERDDVTG